MAADERSGEGEHRHPFDSLSAYQQVRFVLTGPAITALGVLFTVLFLAAGSDIVGWQGMVVGPGMVGVGVYFTWVVSRATGAAGGRTAGGSPPRGVESGPPPRHRPSTPRTG